MPYAIEQVLGYVALMKAIKEVESGVPKPLPPAYYAVRPTDRVVGDRARNFKFKGTRKAARKSEYGAPPRQVALQPRNVQDVILLFATEKVLFRQEFIRILMQWQAGVYGADEQARQEILQQVEEFKTLFDTLRTTAIHSALAHFKFYFDADGYILPSSSGAAETIDLGIPATNTGQVNPGGGAIINASWATSTTDIPTQLNNLKKRAIQLTGRPLRYAFYGSNIPGYLLGNDRCKQYFSFNPSILNAFAATGRPPSDLFELTWLPAYSMFHENAAGDIVEPWPADQITFAPEPTPDTWRLLEGSYMIPKSYQPTGTIEGALANMETVFGMFEYSQVNNLYLPNSEHIAGDTFLPWPCLPESYFQVDVTP
ncbi:MAG TPA: hypothetical protein VD866_01015 [Urbifossiella sp.]|nr:hypothetical protein [Urbifossiella sp.]